MARLGSIIEGVYAASDTNGKFKSKDSPGERIRNILYRDPYALRDDRSEFPSLDGSASSASLDFSNCDEDSSTSSPREVLWQVPRSDSFAERNLPSRLSPLGWPLKHESLPSRPLSPRSPPSPRPKLMERSCSCESKGEKRETEHSEVDMMKERFARLLLGEDMSGGRRGVSAALAISNAITNLSASVFGELWRLEPLAEEKKKMWRREMEWLLSVTDHIVELVPTWQSCPDGSSVEVMVSHPRADLHMNLPALRKLDAMLLDCLDGFKQTEFWYVDQGVAVAGTEEHGTPARNSFPRQEEKWWLPTPKVPADGLSSESKKRLQHQKESVNQILKASMAINAQVLSEMDVPEVYWETLPKNGRASLGEAFYRCIAFEHFSPDAFLMALDLSTEHQALEVANRLEAAIHAWKRKNNQKHAGSKDGLTKTSSWGGLMKDLVGDGDKKELFIGRAESLLLCLRQKFPGLPQTLLDIHKIQYNKDVGQSILESYSRVLESLAYSIISRIDDVLHVEECCSSSDGSEHQVFPIPLSKLSSLRPSVSSSAQAKRETELKGMTASSPKFDRPWKPVLTFEPKNFSYARHLESGNFLHSPPGRD